MIRIEIPGNDFKEFVLDRDIEPFSAVVEFMDAYLDENILIDQLNDKQIFRCPECGYWYEQKSEEEVFCDECNQYYSD